METLDCFISEIVINHVRDLSGITIPISKDTKKHLIITGKNGSGKTSLLVEINKLLKNEFYSKNQLEIINRNIVIYKNILNDLQKNNLSGDHNANQYNNTKSSLAILERQLYDLSSVDLNIYNNAFVKNRINDGLFLIDFETYTRSSQQKEVTGPNKIAVKNVYTPDESISNLFSQFLTNQRMDMLNAREDNVLSKYEEYQQWFKSMQDIFREVFDDEALELKYVSEEKVFYIIQQNKAPFAIAEMSSGYSSYFKIISELLLRMDFIKQGQYNIFGICLIDEIEAHLHIDLQAKALPLLTKFFPNIQFIVTTHSPFIVNSLSNSVVFDLENRILIEDPSRYSAEVITKTFFKAGQYSNDLKAKLKRFDELSMLKSMEFTEPEKQEYADLQEYFRSVPVYFDPHLKSKLLDIELNALQND